MERKELEAMTVIKLRAIAKKEKLLLNSSMKKAEIVSLILAASKKEVKPKKVKKVVKPAALKVIKPKVKKEVKKVAKKIEKKVKKLIAKSVTPISPQTPKRIDTQEELVEESKFFRPVEISYPSKEELPAEYREDKIVIMARDPNWTFAYWEVTPQTIDVSIARAGKGASLTLRVYDITGVDFNGKNALSFFDIGVYERVGNWYIEVGKPDHSFCIDLGFLNAEGSFITMVRSNVITTPRDRVSDITDERWMIMEEDFQKVFALSGGYGIGLSSPELQEIIKKRFAAGIFSFKK